MKKLRTARLHLKSYPYKSTKPTLIISSKGSAVSTFRSIDNYNRNLAIWRYNRNLQFSYNFGAIARFVFRVAICALAVGLVYSLWNKQFDFYHWMRGLVVNDFSPFNYQEFVSKVNDTFEHLPSWLSGLKGVAQIAVSFGYSMEFIFNFLSYIFG